MLILRRILFAFFFLIYVTVCPLLILYALGYLFKPEAPKSLIKTGIICLATAPSGAAIFLDGKEYPEKTPATIRNLLPGVHELQLTQSGCKPWQEKIRVEAEKVTVSEKILLLPEELKTIEISAVDFKDLFSLGGNYLLLGQATLGETAVYDFKEEKLKNLQSTDPSAATEKISSYILEKESPFFILRAQNAGRDDYFAVKPGRNKDFFAENISKLLPEKISKIDWDPSERNNLFTFSEGVLSRIDLEGGAAYSKFAEGVRGYGFFGKNIYILLENNQVKRFDFEGKNEELLLDDAALSNFLFNQKGFFQIHILSKDTMLFLSDKGELLTSRVPYRFADEGIVGFQFEPKLKKLLVWKKDALGVLDFSAHITVDEIFEKGSRLKWIVKDAKNIEQAFFVFEGSHVIFKDDNRVKLVEFNPSGEPRVTDLLNVQPRTSIFYHEPAGRLYYLDNKKSHLSFVEILPEKE